jgi:hypothetical protein
VTWYLEALRRDVQCVQVSISRSLVLVAACSDAGLMRLLHVFLQAFDRLVDQRMLPHERGQCLNCDPGCCQPVSPFTSVPRAEQALLSDLRFAPEQQWLRLMYECKLNQVSSTHFLSSFGSASDTVELDVRLACAVQPKRQEYCCWQGQGGASVSRLL